MFEFLNGLLGSTLVRLHDWDNSDIWRAVLGGLNARKKHGLITETKHVNSHEKGRAAVLAGTMTVLEQRLNILPDELADRGASARGPDDALAACYDAHVDIV